MTFLTPNLDDRTAQQLVDEAKRLIPRYCPEWTDHNVSDPGVALIELFAWMTDLLLYRVNQVPDRMYLRFLEMIGVQLEPPHPAQALLTFYTSKGLAGIDTEEIPIPEGTEAATARVEVSAPVIFATEEAVVIRPVVVGAVYTADGRDAAPPLEHDLNLFSSAGEDYPISTFPEPAEDGDGFYIALERDHSQHVLGLVVKVKTSGGATDIKPEAPPWRWEVAQGLDSWVQIEKEDIKDFTGGFSVNGELLLHLPAMSLTERFGRRAYWVRGIVSDQTDDNRYTNTPRLTSLDIGARGITVRSKNAVTVAQEPLGRSSGQPGQTFRLQYGPLLPLAPERDKLLVVTLDGRSEWTYVSDFADCTRDDQVFSVDYRAGVLRLGPAALQPNGKVHLFGAVPPAGSELSLTRYQHGGDFIGQLPAHSLVVPRASIKYINRVENRRESTPGLAAQSIEEARIQAPRHLRTRTRAVTAEDYEYWAAEVLNVARACCLHPGEQGVGNNGRPAPGYVELRILPQVANTSRKVTADDLKLTDELRNAVLRRLGELRPLGIALDVRPVDLVRVGVSTKLRPTAYADARRQQDLQARATEALEHYLDPFTGGPTGKGWPFGRALYVSEIYRRLQQLAGVGLVEEVVVTVDGRPVAGNRHDIGLGAVIGSEEHKVMVFAEPV